jgi:hypothetical protein
MSKIDDDCKRYNELTSELHALERKRGKLITEIEAEMREAKLPFIEVGDYKFTMIGVQVLIEKI